MRPQNSLDQQLALERRIQRVPLVLGTRFGYNGDQYYYEGHHVQETALQRLSTMLTIPKDFLTKCSPILTTSILTEFLGRTEREMSYVIDRETGEIYSFCWSDYMMLQTHAVVGVVAEAVSQPVTVTKVIVGVQSFAVHITAPDAFTNVKDAAIQPGIFYRGSLDGSTSTTLRFSLFRPICTNGAFIEEGGWTLARRFIRAPESAMIAIGEAAQRLFGLRDAMFENIRKLSTMVLEDPERSLPLLAVRLGISPQLVEEILMSYHDEPDPTIWGAINALTRAANEQESGPDTESLWGLAGNLVYAGERALVCPKCHTGNVIDVQHSIH